MLRSRQTKLGAPTRGEAARDRTVTESSSPATSAFVHQGSGPLFHPSTQRHGNRFDTAVVMAHEGERVTLKIFGVNAAKHDIVIPAFVSST